jgi:UDP-N-acetylglucosamine 3-dehydrogenase
MDGKVLKTAVIGTGYFGEKYANILKDLPSAELVAVCDINEASAAAVGKKYGCNSYGSIDAMLAKEQIDAVAIVVSEDHHLTAVEPVAKAKKHILLEKPIARNYDEARKIVKLAEENNVRLMVAHILKWDGRYQYTAEAIKRGELGDIISMYLKRSSINNDAMRMQDRVSIFHYAGVHDFESMLTFAEPAKPVKVYAQSVTKKNAQYKSTDTVFSTITFDNGIIASIQLCWALPEGGSCNFVIHAEVVGTKGVSYIDLHNQGVAIYRENVPGYFPELTYWPEYYGHVHGALRGDITHFVNNTLSGEPYAVDTQRAVLAVRTIDACLESLKTSMPVEIKY